MNCPHCATDCSAEPCDGQSKDIALRLRRIVRDLARCEHPHPVQVGQTDQQQRVEWCQQCGTIRIGDEWPFRAAMIRRTAKELDDLVASWGYDLGADIRDSGEKIVS